MQKPMLANKFDDSKATFPCYVQPKLDGVRCLFNGTLAWTRNLKEHKPHILRMLQDRYPNLPEGMVLDGELMLPNATFQETISAVKKEYDISETLEYHVYDCYYPDQPNLTFAGRIERVRRYLGDQTVKTVMIYDSESLWDTLDSFIDRGYEGLIYRNPDGAYKHGRSGRDLLKLKKFLDAEYMIVDVIEGRGKDVGTPIWVCRISGVDARTFKARPMGTYEWRREAWKNRLSYIGKVLTVKYQELTDEGIPRFPIGVGVRDYE